jgi:hypothetical protein
MNFASRFAAIRRLSLSETGEKNLGGITAQQSVKDITGCNSTSNRGYVILKEIEIS